MTEQIPSIPGLYDLVVLESTDSSRAHAERLARAGADEGTLVWAKSQREGIGRNGQYWMSGYRNLHCSIILRPEENLEICCQLSLVATICAAMAISCQARPLKEIRYRWPNDVLLNQGKVAGITLSGKLSESRVDWLVVAMNVNVFDSPASKGLKGASMRTEEFRGNDRVQLLETYSREFLSWINRWSEDGFEPVRKTWLINGHQVNDPVSIKNGNSILDGTFVAMEPNGAMKLATGTHHETINIADFYSSEFNQ